MSDQSGHLPDPPTRLGGFRVGERIRESGVLALHAGRDSLDLPVRLHIVQRSALKGSFGPDDFLARVRVLAAVRDTALLSFTTGGDQDGVVYAAARDVEALRVGELLGRGGAMEADRAITVALAVANALAALESAGLAHGDLTPRRILLPGRGAVVVRPARLLPHRLVPRYPRYQAPEQARGDEGDIRSDLFVLGLVLAEMLRGKYPIEGAGRAVRSALAAGRVPPGEVAAPTARPDLQAILTRLLAPDPGARPARAADVVEWLGTAQRGDSLDPRIVSAVPVTAPIPAPPVPELLPLDDDLAEELAEDEWPSTIPLEPDDLFFRGLDPDRPETAPIDMAAVSKVIAAARATHPPPHATAHATAGTPAADGGPRRGKRSPGRLYVQSRLGESMLEIDEDVHVGWPAESIDVHARAEAFDDAVIRIERRPSTDVLHALADDVQVNGTAVREHALAQGDRIEAPRVNARYELAPRQALRATGAGARSRKHPAGRYIALAAVVGSLAAVGWGVSSVLATDDATGRAKAAARTAQSALRAAQQRATDARLAPSEARSGENAARNAYEAAKTLARRRPDEPDLARRKLLDVAERYPETAYGLLARIDADAYPDRSSPRDGSLEEVLANADVDAAEGRLDDALLALRNFADGHRGTVDGAAARRAMVRLESELSARFETDMAAIDTAMGVRDWRAAMRVAERVMDYVPLSLRDRALGKKRSIQAAMNNVLDAGGGAPGSAPPGPEPGAGPGPGPGPSAGTSEGPPPTPDEPGSGAPGRDDEALAAFKAARRLMDAGKDVEAIDGFLEFLREYKDTAPGAKYDLEVRKRITTLAAGPAGVVRLFRGEVEKRDKGRWRVTYDFEDADQLLDFRDVNAFEAPPRANWTVVSGAARAKGSGALALDAKFGAEFLSVQVKVNPERPHDLGTMFFEYGESQRFYLYTIQNSFFALGKGRDTEKFRENAVVLFGPDMWRDTPKGQIGFVRKCGSDKPEFRAGETASIKAGKDEAEVWMRFPGGRTIRGSAYGDVKYEFQGLQPAVFVVNSSGYFDDLIVEGVPDADWVAQRWRDILSGL